MIADATVSESKTAVRRGRLVVLAGPSAVGKSSVVRELRTRLPELVFSVSATTRDPRPGEVDGKDYRFTSREEFQRMIDSGELLEWAEIHGGLQRSGTPQLRSKKRSKLESPFSSRSISPEHELSARRCPRLCWCSWLHRAGTFWCNG